jgi:hypothetical protein
LEKEKKMCRSVITEFGLRLQSMKDGHVEWTECLSTIIGLKGIGEVAFL